MGDFVQQEKKLTQYVCNFLENTRQAIKNKDFEEQDFLNRLVLLQGVRSLLVDQVQYKKGTKRKIIGSSWEDIKRDMSCLLTVNGYTDYDYTFNDEDNTLELGIYHIVPVHFLVICDDISSTLPYLARTEGFAACKSFYESDSQAKPTNFEDNYVIDYVKDHLTALIICFEDITATKNTDFVNQMLSQEKNG